MNTALFSNTPTVTALDNRGLTVRDIAYHRRPDAPEVTRVRITHHLYNATGFLTRSADPRLHAARRANFSYLTSLSGGTLLSDGADNGLTCRLNDTAGRPVIAVSNIGIADDGTDEMSQAVTVSYQYEDVTLPGRPVSFTEQVSGSAARVTERFVYAGHTDAEKAHNLVGICVSHYDTAGLVQTNSLALTGMPCWVTRRLLEDADDPDTVADWQGSDASAWNDLLEGEAYTQLATADAAGAVLTSTDAKGNVQRVVYDAAGLLSGSWLTLAGGTEQAIVKSLTYSAAGQKLQEAHGNGVQTTYDYDPKTQRLTGIKTERPDGHAAGGKVLQDLRYAYDAVGNVVKVSDDAQETRFWRNQKVVPENIYVYNSLYELISATGREMAGAGQRGSRLPSVTIPLPTDSTAYTRYTREYSYDSAGNLAWIRHAPATGSGYTTTITVSNRSNRGVSSALTGNPSEVDALFSAAGQQKQLQPGQHLSWTPRNELLKVTPVTREGDIDDSESYRYDAGSQRLLKVSAQKTGSSVRTQRALYLPGLELRTTRTGSTETERLQVMTVGEAGRAQVRVLHWESGKPDGITDDPIRYSYDNLIGSSTLEVDGGGNIISAEEYYPYGGTAVWTARSQVEAKYKTVRYSGKERDATGLYYYGYRYYQPWAGRWLSADPAGTVDGLNLFRMVRNNPATLQDSDGRMPTDPKDRARADRVRTWDFSHLNMPESPEPESYKFIVHTAPVEHLINRKGIFSHNPNEVIKSWDTMSASLITERQGFTYRSFGAILEVPYQNILSAHHEDLMSELNIGVIDRTEFLARASDKSREKRALEETPSHVRSGMLSREISNHHIKLSTPDVVLENTDNARNEIIIATRPFVNVTEGLPATGEVKIKGYFLAASPHSSFAIKFPPRGSSAVTREDNLLLEHTYAYAVAREARVPFFRLNARPDVYDYMKSHSIDRLRMTTL